MSTPIRVFQSHVYRRWFAGVRDDRIRSRILARLRRVSLGNFGDARALGGGLHELRIDYGPGYRIYFVRRGTAVLLALGGDKSRQRTDIDRAREIAAAWEPDDGS